jgi:N-acyl amino acid synthase of PEP-CTERM/exosortase system
MFPFDIHDLGASFKRYFEIVPAFTDELREQAYRIRHKVYCEELGFEPVRASGLEIDAYDAQSLHCLIRSVKINRFVGCTRVVLTRADDRLRPLPFEKLCAGTIDRAIVDPQGLARGRIAEVSRLAVISQFRLRRGEREMCVPINDESFGTEVQPRFPYIPVGLYLGTLELARLHGVDTLFVLTERRLATHFARLGVEITRIGREIEHRGIRVPSMMRVRSIIDGLNFIMRPLYNAIAKEVQEGLSTQHARA